MAEPALVDRSTSLSFLDEPLPFDPDFDFDFDNFDPFDIINFSFDDLPPLLDLAAGDGSPDSADLSASRITAEESKSEEERNFSSAKRKKVDEDNADPHPNPGRNKRWRSSASPVVKSSLSPIFNSGSEEEEKRRLRLARNRESAQLSRQRKKQQVEELESKLKSMQATIADLNSRISFIMAENAGLRQQLAAGGGGGNGAAVPLIAPVYFPWPQGPLGPLIPIPRMKPQQPAPAPRTKNGRDKTKKIASVSFLGLMFVVLVLGFLFPGLSLKYRGSGDQVLIGSGADKDWFSGQLQGSVWSVSGRTNRLNGSEGVGFYSGVNGLDKNDDIVQSNSSEILPALLYVPRNGKHVEINGNLVIHSVLASERARADKGSMAHDEKGTALAIAGDMMTALGVSSEFSDTYGDNLESVLADGSLQQWLYEGLAGPVLSSSMCTEVLRFDISPSSANQNGLVPATSAVNVTGKLLSSLSHPRRMKNRRILQSQRVPLTESSSGDRTEHLGKPSNGGYHRGEGSVPSMVVSVLVDPRETGDVGSDGMNSPNRLSRIFVVVLLDSVKYITYSCVLPMKSSGSIL